MTDPDVGDEDGSGDWEATKQYLHDHPTKWLSLSWVAARTLIQSVNHVLATGAAPLIPELRNHWSQTANEAHDLRVVRAGASRFIVAGDPGEQDASQYVVAPALARAAAVPGTDFLLILSDVIYPSGDVNDYVDGFHKPYHQMNTIDVPIFAVPGNHDWYDGLHGFAYQFLRGVDAPDEAIFAPDFSPVGFAKRVADRLCRTLMRLPSGVLEETKAARTKTSDHGQPGPYFVIETEHLELVCIDTGIDGTIDQTQMDWLCGLDGDKPKILMTGKPLRVNGLLHECAVTGSDAPTVFQVVTQDRGYVATIGGDVHNFQEYSPRHDGLVHLVSGGAGAYTHATHTIRMATSDGRVDGDAAPEVGMFPRSTDSLSYFADQLVPSVWRMFRTMLLFALGIAAVSVSSHLHQSVTIVGRTWDYRDLGWLAAALLVLPVLGRALHKSRAGEGKGFHRFALGLEALGLGGLVTWLGRDLAGPDFPALVSAYAVASAWVMLNALGMRVSRWWAPNEDASGAFQNLLFIGATAVLAGAALLGADEWAPGGQWPVRVAVAAYALIALVCWFWVRRVADASTRGQWWRTNSVWVASVAQGLVLLTMTWQLLRGRALDEVFYGGLGGILLLALILAICALLPLLADLGLGAGTPQVRARWMARRRRFRVALFAAPVALLGGWVGLVSSRDLGLWADSAFALPAFLVVVISVPLTTDKLRREFPQSYKLILIALLAAVSAGLWWVDGYDHWAGQSVTAGAVVVVALVASLITAHLFFIGAPWLLLDWGAHRNSVSSMSSTSSTSSTPEDPGDTSPGKLIGPEDAQEIINATQESRAPNVSLVVRRRANIAFPGLTPPFGPIQKFVAEIYSSDEPPFFKHFLVFDSTEESTVITLHKVHGDQPVDQSQTITVPHRPA